MCVYVYVCVQVLVSTAEKLKNFAVPYLVDISEVPDFNSMYGMECIEHFIFVSLSLSLEKEKGSQGRELTRT